MMRSMYASVSGLKVHQTKMDIIGNNISNINTLGYKGSRATFKETLAQTMRGATSPNAEQGTGGTNPVQVGLGVQLGSVDTDMSSGNLQPTGKNTDVAIQGDGLFVVNDGKQDFYTRAGSFAFDKSGYLFSSANGFRVQGWVADESGDLGSMGPDNVGDIILDKSMNPDQTENISYSGNLNMAQDNLMEVTSKVGITGVNSGSDNMTVELSKTDTYNFYKFDLTTVNSTFTNPSSADGKTFTGYVELDADGNIEGVYGDAAKTNPITQVDLNSIDGDNTDTLTLPLNTTGKINDENNPFIGNTDEPINVKYELKAERPVSVDVFDSMGKQHNITFTFKKTGDNEWTIKQDTIEVTDGTQPAAGFFDGATEHKIYFDKDGNVKDGERVDISFLPYGGLGQQDIKLDLSSITQYAGNMTADFENVDGYPQGEFQSMSIDPSGNITGSFSNGQSKTLGKVALAMFSNPAGLSREGGLLRESNNSGQARIGAPGINGRGSLAPGSLEMSNVDLSEQFTEMISAQRGFQASSKLITTSDEMLQQLVNLKR